MQNQADQLKDRTKAFAVRVVKLYRSLPKTEEARIVGRQLLRAATSVAANYRSVCRARSRPDFISKIGLVVEEADEVVFWLELLADADIIARLCLTDLVLEATELLAIFAASQRTVKGRDRVAFK